MTRAALLAAALCLAACSPDTVPSCPGRAFGRFAFDAALATSVTPLPSGLDPNPGVPECGGALVFPPALASFDATLAAEEGSSAGALCRSSGQVLFGTRAGQRWTVETSSDGAVLGACGPTCTATSLTVISGDVLPDLVDPAEFRGVLVEQLTRSEGACECVLPCAARYVLHGAEVAQ